MYNKILKETLQQVIDNIDSGNSNISEESMITIVDTINKCTNTQNKLSKYQAMKMLNVSRATFDRYVADGLLPEGKKEQGFKEKFWYKKDIDEFIRNKPNPI